MIKSFFLSLTVLILLFYFLNKKPYAWRYYSEIFNKNINFQSETIYILRDASWSFFPYVS